MPSTVWRKRKSLSFSLKYSSNTNTYLLTAHTNYWPVNQLNDGQRTDTNTASTLTHLLCCLGYTSPTKTCYYNFDDNHWVVNTLNSSSTVASMSTQSTRTRCCNSIVACFVCSAVMHFACYLTTKNECVQFLVQSAWLNVVHTIRPHSHWREYEYGFPCMGWYLPVRASLVRVERSQSLVQAESS